MAKRKNMSLALCKNRTMWRKRAKELCEAIETLAPYMDEHKTHNTAESEWDRAVIVAIQKAKATRKALDESTLK